MIGHLEHYYFIKIYYLTWSIGYISSDPIHFKSIYAKNLICFCKMLHTINKAPSYQNKLHKVYIQTLLKKYYIMFKEFIGSSFLGNVFLGRNLNEKKIKFKIVSHIKRYKEMQEN